MQPQARANAKLMVSRHWTLRAWCRLCTYIVAVSGLGVVERLKRSGDLVEDVEVHHADAQVATTVHCSVYSATAVAASVPERIIGML